jgi:hypothetical protein
MHCTKLAMPGQFSVSICQMQLPLPSSTPITIRSFTSFAHHATSLWRDKTKVEERTAVLTSTCCSKQRNPSLQPMNLEGLNSKLVYKASNATDPRKANNLGKMNSTSDCKSNSTQGEVCKKSVPHTCRDVDETVAGLMQTVQLRYFRVIHRLHCMQRGGRGVHLSVSSEIRSPVL